MKRCGRRRLLDRDRPRRLAGARAEPAVPRRAPRHRPPRGARGRAQGRPREALRSRTCTPSSRASRRRCSTCSASSDSVRSRTSFGGTAPANVREAGEALARAPAQGAAGTAAAGGAGDAGGADAGRPRPRGLASLNLSRYGAGRVPRFSMIRPFAASGRALSDGKPRRALACGLRAARPARGAARSGGGRGAAAARRDAAAAAGRGADREPGRRRDGRSDGSPAVAQARRSGGHAAGAGRGRRARRAAVEHRPVAGPAAPERRAKTRHHHPEGTLHPRSASSEPGAGAARAPLKALTHASLHLSRRPSCTPRTSTFGALADTVGTPFYCYSTATLERHYRVFAEAFAGTDALVCYAVKANSNQAVLATLAGLGAGMDIVSEGELRRALGGGACRPSASSSPASARPATRWRPGSMPASSASTSSPSPSWRRSPRSRPRRAAVRRSRCGSTRTSTRGPTARSRPASPRTSSASRSRAPARSMRARRGCPALKVTGVDMHIGSQITELGPFANATQLLAELARDLLAEGHALRHIDLGGGLGIPYRERRSAASRAACLRGRHQAPHAGPRPQADLRDRAHDRRQRRHPGDARRLCEARRGQDLRHRRRRHERPHPSDALRGRARDQAGARSPRRARRASSPTSSGRCARPAITSPSGAS